MSKLFKFPNVFFSRNADKNNGKQRTLIIYLGF